MKRGRQVCLISDPPLEAPASLSVSGRGPIRKTWFAFLLFLTIFRKKFKISARLTLHGGILHWPCLCWKSFSPGLWLPGR